MSLDRARVVQLAASSARVAATLCAAAGMAVFGGGQATAEDLLPEGVFTMQDASDGSCMTEVPEADDSGRGESTLAMRECESDTKTQQWRKGEEFSDGRFTLKSNGSKQCLSWVIPRSSIENNPTYGVVECTKAARFTVKSAGEETVLFKERDSEDSSTTYLVISRNGHVIRSEVENTELAVNQWKLTAVG